ncbi:MAG: endonuclease/exonuclease/phosphatase family protein, partial [Segetibacter sp.]
MMKIKTEGLLFKSLQKFLLNRVYFIVLVFFSSCLAENEVVQVINGNTVKLSNGCEVRLIGVSDSKENLIWLRDSVNNREITLLNSDKEVIDNISSFKIDAFVYTEEGLFVNRRLSKVKTSQIAAGNGKKDAVLKSNENTISICSWNLKDFGNSKNEEELGFIADIIKGFDVVAIQEVVAGSGGPQAVARLSDVLNRKGAKWDYTISDPTSGENSYKQERYAFLWKPSKLSKKGDAWLERQYNAEIDREPYFASFENHGRLFTLANFHAITKKMQPETEIKYFKYIPAEYPSSNLIFAGDFNCPQSHSVFNPLKTLG